MKAGDVTDTLELALAGLGLRQRHGRCNGPRLLSQTMAPSYISGDLAEWLAFGQGMEHVRGAPLPSPDPGQDRALAPDLKNRILLENYFLPGALEAQIAAFVEHYNHQRYHESLGQPHTRRRLLRQRGQTILPERDWACAAWQRAVGGSPAQTGSPPLRPIELHRKTARAPTRKQA
jgi:putative transposase